jgi:putative tryptophan/tyrosine transport system substrate-binding protein
MRFSISDTSTRVSTDFGFWIERLKRRTSFCLVLSGLLVVIGAVAEAQQPERIPRIGYLPSAGAPIPRQFKALQEGLRDLGYVEGKNIVIESRQTDGKLEAPDLVKELLQLKVDVLIAVDPTSLRAAKQATKNVPIVMVTNQDPVATGLVNDLARPSGNVTGIARLTRDLSGKRLEILKEIIPSISRVGVLWVRPTALGVGTAFQNYEPTADALKIQLQSLPVSRPNPDLAGAIQEAVQEGYRL